MTKHRTPIQQYRGNRQFVGIGTGTQRYCMGKCQTFRLSRGGKPMGKLKLWHCAECVAAKTEGSTV